MNEEIETPVTKRPMLHHYSQGIVTKVKSRDVTKRGCGAYKPNGFWVSVDEKDEDGKSYGWSDWCKDEDFLLDHLTVRHRVHLFHAERLLWITNANDLVWFDKTFGKDGLYGPDIDWPLLAEQFAGIVIAPYQWSRRFDLHWYYGWDCASGVIWDASIVRHIAVVHDGQDQ